MSDESSTPSGPPTLDDYEELAGVEFDLSDTDLDEATINQVLADLYDG